ncbi:MAG: hypothetical protein PWQ57_411 [Desulfovibrionales bacterium]|nr:hypothetical protein [Desulfovibrionales bacterium]
MSESYRRRLSFFLTRAMDRMRNKRLRRAVINRLCEGRFVLSVYLCTSTSDKHLAEAQLIDFAGGELVLGVFSSNKRMSMVNPKGRRVRVYFRPFGVAGRKINVFETYVADVFWPEPSRKAMTLLAPMNFGYLPRRRFDRRKLKSTRAFQCKVWLDPEKYNFWTSPADIGAGSHVGNGAGAAKIVNISQGGLSVAVHPVQLRRPVRRGTSLGLALKAYDTQRGEYNTFLLKGRAVSIRRDPSGMLLVGVEFRSQARRPSKGGLLSWTRTLDGLPELGRMIQAMENRSRSKSEDKDPTA